MGLELPNLVAHNTQNTQPYGIQPPEAKSSSAPAASDASVKSQSTPAGNPTASQEVINKVAQGNPAGQAKPKLNNAQDAARKSKFGYVDTNFTTVTGTDSKGALRKVEIFTRNYGGEKKDAAQGAGSTQYYVKIYTDQNGSSQVIPIDTVNSTKDQAVARVRQAIKAGELGKFISPPQSYESGLREMEPYRFDTPTRQGLPTDREKAFEKDVTAWVNSYVNQRFPPPLREKAGLLMRKILEYYGDKPEQAYIRQTFKEMLSSSRGGADNALKILVATRLELSGAKPKPLEYSGLTPLKTIESVSLQKMGRRSFNDLTDFILSTKNVSTANNETPLQAKDRLRAEQHVRNFARSWGQTDVTNITIKPRDPKNIIALTHQESSMEFMKHPSSFASDISYDSKGVGGIPLRSKFTMWFNPSGFGRIGMPYMDTKGYAIDPATNNKKPATSQMVARAGFFEAGIQGQVGLNTSEGRAKYANTGFSVAIRGPSWKGVGDRDTKGPSSLPEPKKVHTLANSFNMSVDASGYVSLGIFRAGPYFEIGRFASGKAPHLLDKFNIGLNPDFVKDVQEGKFKLYQDPYKNLAPLSPY